MKSVLRDFLIKYKISPLKYTLNKSYHKNPFPVDYVNNHKDIAPSLRILKARALDLPSGYPDWFCIAFPDVVLFFMDGDGYKLLLQSLSRFDENQALDGRHLKLNILAHIIELYILSNKDFECKKY